MSSRPVILDCDPGVDDAVAILLALASPELELRAITTVAGNVSVEQATENALKLCALAGRSDIPVHAGCARPLARAPAPRQERHGTDGLGGVKLPMPPVAPHPQSAVEVLVEAGPTAAPGSLTLCITGPHTNVAAAIARDPRFLRGIGEIVLMGGATSTQGSVTPVAEFNIHSDPHAGSRVFACRRPIVQFGLELTFQVIATPARRERIRGVGTLAAVAVAAMLEAHTGRHLGRVPADASALHDPCVIAWLIRPDLFQGRKVHVEVETCSELTMGQTVADWWRVTGREENAFVMTDADVDGFFDLLVERLARLPG